MKLIVLCLLSFVPLALVGCGNSDTAPAPTSGTEVNPATTLPNGPVP